MAKSSKKLRGWAREIIVIFVGISLAFMVENFRANREDKARLGNHLMAISKALKTDSIMNETYIYFAEAKVKRVDSLLVLIEQEDGVREKLLLLAYLQETRETDNLDNAFNAFLSSGDYSLLDLGLREDLSFYYKTCAIYKHIDARQLEWTMRELNPFCDKNIHPDDKKFHQYADPKTKFGTWPDDPPKFKSRLENLDETLVLNYGKRCRDFWNLMGRKYMRDRQTISKLRTGIATYLE